VYAAQNHILDVSSGKKKKNLAAIRHGKAEVEAVGNQVEVQAYGGNTP